MEMEKCFNRQLFLGRLSGTYIFLFTFKQLFLCGSQILTHQQDTRKTFLQLHNIILREICLTMTKVPII